MVICFTIAFGIIMVILYRFEPNMHCCKLKQLNSWVSSHTVPQHPCTLNFTSFSALLDFVSRATVVAQASVVCASSILPLTEGSQKPLPGSRPNVMESYLSTISSDVFIFIQKFHLSNFYDFFSFSLTWDLIGAKISKRSSSYNFHPI